MTQGQDRRDSEGCQRGRVQQSFQMARRFPDAWIDRIVQLDRIGHGGR